MGRQRPALGVLLGVASCPLPEYSETGREAGLTSASVTLTVRVSTKGNARKINVSRDAGYGFTEPRRKRSEVPTGGRLRRRSRTKDRAG
jgi:hypothetical protein